MKAENIILINIIGCRLLGNRGMLLEINDDLILPQIKKRMGYIQADIKYRHPSTSNGYDNSEYMFIKSEEDFCAALLFLVSHAIEENEKVVTMTLMLLNVQK